jgi:hypothetical protein
VWGISLADARKAAKAKLGEVARGDDPSAARKEARRREHALLKPAIEDYEKNLERRRIAKRREVISLLKRELLGRLGNIDLATIDRATLVGRINAIGAAGQAGKAQDFRSKRAVFLGWAVNEGMIPASPLAG